MQSRDLVVKHITLVVESAWYAATQHFGREVFGRFFPRGEIGQHLKRIEPPPGIPIGSFGQHDFHCRRRF